MRLVAYSNYVTCFDWPLGKMKRTYRPENCRNVTIKNLCWSPNSDKLCLVTSGGNLEFVRYEMTNVKSADSVNLQDVNCAVFPNVAEHRLTITQDRQLVTYEIKQPQLKGSFVATSQDGSAFDQCCYTYNDKFLCVSTMSHNLYLYNTQNPEMNICFPKKSKVPIHKFATSNQALVKVAAVLSNGMCYLWDVSDYKHIYMDPSTYYVNDLAFDQGNSLVCVTNDGRCIFRDINNAMPTKEMLLDFNPQAIDFCLDGVGFAITDDNGTIFGYDVRHTKRHHCRLQIPIDGIGGSTSKIRLAFEKNSKAPNIALYDVASKCSVRTTSETVFNVNRGDSLVTVIEQNESDHTLVDCSQSEPNHLVEKKTVHTQTQRQWSSEYTLKDLRNQMTDLIKNELGYVKEDLQEYMCKAILDGTQRHITNLRLSMINEFVNLDKGIREQLEYYLER